MKITPAVAVLLSLPVLICAQVTAPSAGRLRYQNGKVDSLFGLPGNLLAGDSNIGTATAISCSGAGCLVAKSGRIELLNPDASLIASYPAEASVPPLLNMGATLRSAVGWLANAHVLLGWSGKSFTVVPVDSSAFGGVITSVTAADSQAHFLVTHPDGLVSGVTVSLVTGSMLSSDILPGIHGPAFEIGSDILWLEDHNIHIDEANGRRYTLPIAAGDIGADRMSANWIHVFSPSSGMHWALDVNGNAPTLSAIPVRAIQLGAGK